ncbi:hypothetical protein N0V90_009376 [Kalmusia sp. IMI 367209]|nr:hypothetical protein N0V90_009376 [Kalmusia sp. IMI 367209]
MLEDLIMETTPHDRVKAWLKQDINKQVEQQFGKEFWKVATLATLSVRCSCNECAPEAYVDACVGHSGHIRPAKAGQALTFGPLKTRYEALELAHAAVAVMTRPQHEMTPEQLLAIGVFQSCWKKEWKYWFGEQPLDPNRCKMNYLQLIKMARLLSTIMFSMVPEAPGLHLHAVSAERFVYSVGWDESVGPDYDGIMQLQDGLPVISLNPNARGTWRYDRGKLAVERLGTLVHELIHAFLAMFSCESCNKANDNLQKFEGHGRAWHLMAKAAEEALPRLLWVQLDTGRRSEITRWRHVDFKGHSLHDLVSYGFLTEHLTEDHTGDQSYKKRRHCELN